ncbi:MAG: hypothetical protein WDN46_03485 [Methylocella sp.]
MIAGLAAGIDLKNQAASTVKNSSEFARHTVGRRSKAKNKSFARPERAKA